MVMMCLVVSFVCSRVLVLVIDSVNGLFISICLFVVSVVWVSGVWVLFGVVIIMLFIVGLLNSCCGLV